MSAADNKRSKSTSPVLPASLADRICRGLLSLAELGAELSESLILAGFGAHRPWQRFFESFAADEAELHEYRLYRVETTKNAIGRPWPRSMFDQSWPYFFSAHIKTLLERRDRENGVDENELSTRYPAAEALWRLELNKCDMRRVRLEMEQRSEYERLRAQAAEASRLQLRSEVGIRGTDVCARYTSDPDDRIDCYVAAMEQHSAKLGFRRDIHKSKGRIPIFSKGVAGDWDICWAIEQPELFLGVPREGQFAPDLQLRSHGLVGSVNSAPVDRFLAFRYPLIVPEFNRGYHLFSDGASLETVVRAHLALYELMAPTLEGAIRHAVLH